MGGNTTQPMGGASSLMGGGQDAQGGGYQDMSQFAGNGAMGALQNPGASQDMSQYAGNGGAGKGSVNSGAPGNYPPPPGYGPGQGGMPGMLMGQQGYPGMDSKAISADPAGFAQHLQGAQRQEVQYPGSTFLSQGQSGQGAPQNMNQFAGNGSMTQFAGNGAMNQLQGNQGNYPPPSGYGPRQDVMPGMLMGQGAQGMNQFDSTHLRPAPTPLGYAPGGAVPETMGQGAQGGAPQNIPQLLQQNQPAMGALPQFDLQSLMLNQSGGQGNIPIQAGARAPVAFGAPNPSGAPMLAEQVKAPPKPPTPPPQQIDYASLMSGLGFKNGGATNSQDSHTVIQNALRLLSNRN